MNFKKLINTRYYPWLVILFSAFFLFYKYVLQVSPSVMTDQLMTEFHLNGVGLGNLAATFFYSYLVVQLFVGPLLDKYSSRLLSSVSIAISALGAFAFAFAPSITLALIGRALMGVGAAFATVSYMKMAAEWFEPSRFALVSGLLATAAMLGSMAGQAPMALMVAHLSWRPAMLVAAIFGVALAVLYFVFVRNNSDSSRFQYAKSHPHGQLKLSDFLGILKRKHNWLLMLYSGMAFSPLAVFGGLWGNPYLRESMHISTTEAASLTSIMFFGLAFGGPFWGWVSDRLNKRYLVMQVGLIVSLVGCVCTIYVDFNPWLEGLFLFLFGFGVGAFMLGFALGKELNPIGLAATVVGLINTGDALFGAFSEPLVGKILDTFWRGKTLHGAIHFTPHDFHISFVMLPLYLVLAFVCLWLLRSVAQSH